VNLVIAVLYATVYLIDVFSGTQTPPTLDGRGRLCALKAPESLQLRALLTNHWPVLASRIRWADGRRQIALDTALPLARLRIKDSMYQARFRALPVRRREMPPRQGRFAFAARDGCRF